jgi:hypothetical protein
MPSRGARAQVISQKSFRATAQGRAGGMAAVFFVLFAGIVATSSRHCGQTGTESRNSSRSGGPAGA